MSNRYSGTNGLSGAADTLAILRRGRNQADGVLFITGRDVEEKQLALSFNGLKGWTLLGDTSAYEVSDTSRKIFEYLKEHGGKMPKELGNALNVKDGTVRSILSRLKEDGTLIKDGKNYYVKDAETTG